jgi:hypothetical protein
VTAAYMSQSDVNSSLATFEFMPAALKGTCLPLFEHMISKRCIDPKGEMKDAPRSAHFDVSISSASMVAMDRSHSTEREEGSPINGNIFWKEL